MMVEVKKRCGVEVAGHSSGGYGSVGEREMESDKGSRKGETRG